MMPLSYPQRAPKRVQLCGIFKWHFSYPLSNPVDQDSAASQRDVYRNNCSSGSIIACHCCVVYANASKSIMMMNKERLMNRRIQTQGFSSHPYNVFDESTSKITQDPTWISPTPPPEKKKLRKLKIRKRIRLSSKSD